MKALLILTSFFIFSAFAQDIQLQVDGAKHASISLEEIKKVKSENVEFFNQITKRAEFYKGVPTLDFIEKYLPEVSPKGVEVEFIAENGYKSYVPMDLLTRTPSILAYERADGDVFKRYSSKTKTLVPLGPLYLVWNLKAVTKENRSSHSTVYQINTINVLTTKTAVVGGENEKVVMGFKAYKQNCIMCHALGKTGGNVGVDLVKRKILETKGSEYVKKYLLNPGSLNPKTKMLPLPELKNREEIADAIVELLRFLQNPDQSLTNKKSSADKRSYEALKNVFDEISH